MAFSVYHRPTFERRFHHETPPRTTDTRVSPTARHREETALPDREAGGTHRAGQRRPNQQAASVWRQHVWLHDLLCPELRLMTSHRLLLVHVADAGQHAALAGDARGARVTGF